MHPNCQLTESTLTLEWAFDSTKKLWNKNKNDQITNTVLFMKQTQLNKQIYRKTELGNWENQGQKNGRVAI